MIASSNRLYCLILIFFALTTQAQPAVKPDPSYKIRYDHAALRIPGRSFAIGLIVYGQGRKAADTIGYPGKNSGWSKYRLSVDSGSISGGTVKLKRSEAYSRKIPYNYEDSIVLLSNGNNDRSPGDHLKFGVRTIYDDKQFADVWFPVKKKAGRRFLLGFDGAHLSKSKGDLKIDNDVSRISGDRIRVFARLAKNSAIGDTLSLLLDYTAQYKCLVRSGDAGHPLGVDVSLLDDSIIHARWNNIQKY